MTLFAVRIVLSMLSTLTLFGTVISILAAAE